MVGLLLGILALLLWLLKASNTGGTRIAGTAIPSAQKSYSVAPSMNSQTTPGARISEASRGPSIQQAQAARRKAAVENILGALATPITFYGKVIDQNGDPVSNANVKYGTIDRFDAEGSHYNGKSDN